MRHLLVAPQEFKRVLAAREVAGALAAGFSRIKPAWIIKVVPLADGGPGTLDAFLSVRSGEERTAQVEDPLGRTVLARWALLHDGTAVLEMAEASGLWRLRREERNAAIASTWGTGQLIRAALDAGASSLIIGAGGSATNDGGAGALQALGVQLFDEIGNEVPRGGAALASVARIDASGLDPRLLRTPVRVLTDVRNPLLGPMGATSVFGAQKGADERCLLQLEAALTHFQEIVTRATTRDLSTVEGAGAAGGLAWGLAAFAGAHISSGFSALAELLQLERLIEDADLVITGEGRLDAQTGFGKGPARLAQVAKVHHKRSVCFCGVAERGAPHAFDEVVEVSPRALPASREEAVRLVTSAAERWALAQPD